MPRHPIYAHGIAFAYSPSPGCDAERFPTPTDDERMARCDPYDIRGDARQRRETGEHFAQGNPHRPIQPPDAANAGLPYDVVCFLPMFFWLVWHRALNGDST